MGISVKNLVSVMRVPKMFPSEIVQQTTSFSQKRMLKYFRLVPVFGKISNYSHQEMHFYKRKKMFMQKDFQN